MVNNVGVDDAVEDVTTNEAKVTVDSCEGSSHESPALAIVVRDIFMSMVKVRDGNYNNVSRLNHTII